MTEIFYTKEEALAVVAGDKFYNVLFNEIADCFPSRTLINLGNKLNIKVGDLYNLDPKQLSGLFMALNKEKDKGDAEKNAFNNVCDAISKKVKLFSEGKIDIPINKAEDMLDLFQKLKTISKFSNTEFNDLYVMAEKRLKIAEVKCDAFHYLDNISETDIVTVNDNIEQMQSWRPDVTKLVDYENTSKAALKKSVFSFVDQIIDKTVVLGEYTLFGRTKIAQKDSQNRLKKDSELALWLENVRDLTIREMCLSNSKITSEQFDNAFAENIETEFLKLANVDKIVKGKNKKKDFKSLIKSIYKNKDIKINQSSFSGYATAAAVERDFFIDRLIKKIDVIEEKITDTAKKLLIGNCKNQIADKLNKAAKKLDSKAEKLFGNSYTWGKDTLKGFADSVSWGIAFGVASYFSGPVGVSIVSAVSLYRYGYPFIKEYRAKKKEQRSKGKKLTFKAYLKKNKTTTLALAFNALSVAVPLIDVAGNSILKTIANNRILDFARANSAIGIALVQGGNEYRNARNNNEGIIKASIKGTACCMSGVIGFMIGNVMAQNTLMALGDNSVASGRDAAGKVGTLVKKIVNTNITQNTTLTTSLNLSNKQTNKGR